MKQNRFEKDAPVYVTRLGPAHGDRKYKAEVVGVAVDEIANGPFPSHYIIRLLEKIRDDYNFDYMVVTGACLDERGNEPKEEKVPLYPFSLGNGETIDLPVFSF